ncbi:MAG: hypothetical protein DMG48_02970 [Acidobacteria bacterium]|nr:MAG: hypothetical protein DMG48_02970 [Acidobacteriota bacterium]
MEKFNAHTFFAIARVLERLRGVQVENPKEVIKKDSIIFTSWLPDLKAKCDALNLRLASKLITRGIDRIDRGTETVSEWQGIIPEIQSRIQDEMEQNLFMFIPPDRASRYNRPELLGEEVNKKFPTIQYDVAEAGNCYAAGRSTAVVFHLMRIMEVGVQQFGTKLGVTLTNEKNWQNILDEINKAIKALDQRAQTTKEFAAASANLYSVKLAWRNEVMHPNDTYTLEEADNLIRQVHIFMGQLAKVV